MRPLGIITTALVAIAVITSALPLHRCTPEGSDAAMTVLVGTHAHDHHDCDHDHGPADGHEPSKDCGHDDFCCIDGTQDPSTAPVARPTFAAADAPVARWIETPTVARERLHVDARTAVPRGSPARTEVLLI